MIAKGIVETETHVWPEVESRVHLPGRWVVLVIGVVFIVMGTVSFLTLAIVVPPGWPMWIANVVASLFLLAGIVLIGTAVRDMFVPTYVRHASPDVLPSVPAEPVAREGSVVFGRLTHELVEDSEGWQFRPASRLWRNDKRFLFGFGVPFLVFFASVLTWVFHNQLPAIGWIIPAIVATIATLVCGGTTFLLAGMAMRSGYSRLARLTIPWSGDEIEVDMPEAPTPGNTDLAEGMKQIFLGETKRERWSIPRDSILAVQLCPWKYVVGRTKGRSTAWSVQGLIVIGSREEAKYHRFPVLLTSDFLGASRLMQQLSQVLNVPYFFSADAEGWKAEAVRAKTRPPLACGGWQS